jgi:glycosyltransferase involved in cell wall biosynthesis
MGVQDGVPYLLNAADHVVNSIGRKDVQFLLMGTGEDYDKLVSMRSELGLDDFVDLPGRVSDEFLASALQTMDVGMACDPINDFNHHCTMNKTLEYMVFGKPQVMFDIREGRHSAGDAAAYVSENDPKMFGESLVALLDDADRRKTMGELGRHRLCTELSWEHSVKQLRRAYACALQYND